MEKVKEIGSYIIQAIIALIAWLVIGQTLQNFGL
jgi:hypothetical protein